MRTNYLKLLLLFSFLNIFSQEKKDILSGNITIVTNQKMNFKNLRFEDNEVKFFNTETKSEFIYFISAIKTIEDSEGNIVYGKKEDIKTNLKPKPKVDWIKKNDSLRNKNQIRAEIIFKNGDTLKTHIKVSTNAFDSTMLNELSVTNTINSISNNVKVKYSAEEIKSLRFIDFRDNERIFIANGKELVELLFDGKINWCRLYHSYRPGDVSSTDFMINQESKHGVGIGGFNNRRKKLKEITISRPDLIPFIENMKINDENILELLKMYNE